VTLKFLDTGDYYETLSLVFKISLLSISRKVPEVGRTIVEKMKNCCLVSKYII